MMSLRTPNPFGRYSATGGRNGKLQAGGEKTRENRSSNALASRLIRSRVAASNCVIDLGRVSSCTGKVPLRTSIRASTRKVSPSCDPRTERTAVPGGSRRSTPTSPRKRPAPSSRIGISRPFQTMTTLSAPGGGVASTTSKSPWAGCPAESRTGNAPAAAATGTSPPPGAGRGKRRTRKRRARVVVLILSSPPPPRRTPRRPPGRRPRLPGRLRRRTVPRDPCPGASRWRIPA